ncbi:MAG TPA: carboxylating nicotinate-nucleotide diphosphorylase [Longimicrobiales bacterium]|nr:carboxylating nicotinate-nucleotide diphosphorylase [Longimicrobiales bacterium]
MANTTETTRPPAPPADVLERHARGALAEDVGAGDVTSDLVVPADAPARATLVAREPGIACGLALARTVFLLADHGLAITLLARDGDAVSAGAPLLAVSGAARPILSAERVALNFVGRLSGIASLTRRYVDAVAGTGARILDTRKTTPGLRELEKWAVRCGGGHNHRSGLWDGFMLKDNHRAALAAAGVDLVEAVRKARGRLPEGTLVTIEVDALEQIEEALAAGADNILLDNMTPDQLATAAARIAGAALTEASGGIRLESVRPVAACGVDRISVGALTHSAPALDVALDFAWEPATSAAGPAERS